MTMRTGEQTGMVSSPGTLHSQVACEHSCEPNTRGRLRHELRSAVVQSLNDAKLPYCILGAALDSPEFADSDMDFAVRPEDFSAVPHLLASAAATVGAMLVQAIQHETAATYFAVAKQQGDAVGFLHPDCTTDYRRKGRLWIISAELLRGRRRVEDGYFRPAPDIDFKYYLIKQVLKQRPSNTQWRNLLALCEAADHPREALSWCRPETAAQVEQALLHHDRDLFTSLVPHIGYELNGAARGESLFARTSAFARDGARVIGRIAHPTGLFVQITGGSPEERARLSRNLAQILAPAFRRMSVAASANPARILRALVESTLVVSPKQTLPGRAMGCGLDIPWKPELSPAKNLECAIAAVLSHLSQRTMRRLKLQMHHQQAVDLNPVTNTTT